MSDGNGTSFATANAKTKKCISGPVANLAPEGAVDAHSGLPDTPAKPVSAPAAPSAPARQQALDTVRKVIARLIRWHRLDYTAFETICKAARKETGLRRPGRSRRLPRLLPESSLRRFYD